MINKHLFIPSLHHQWVANRVPFCTIVAPSQRPPFTLSIISYHEPLLLFKRAQYTFNLFCHLLILQLIKPIHFKTVLKQFKYLSLLRIIAETLLIFICKQAFSLQTMSSSKHDDKPTMHRENVPKYKNGRINLCCHLMK
jgi:hypothetical protein